MGIFTNTIFPADGDLGNGGVIQMVQTVKTDTFAVVGTGGSWNTVTGLSVTITPRDSSNNILVIPSVNMAANASHRHGFRVMRGGTPVFIGDANSSNQRATVFAGNAPTSANSYHFTPLCLDDPATNSAVTYSIQIRGESNSTDIFINRPHSTNTGGDFFRGCSTIIVMEVSS